MSTVFLFHGTAGSPKSNWLPWLKTELEERGHRVIVPAFPHAEKPDLESWKRHFEQWTHLVDDSTVLVGHSLGGAFALRLIEETPKTLAATFLVASVSGPMGNAFDPILTSFIDHPYDWVRIRAHCQSFCVLHADDDPYIRLEQAESMAKNLGTTITLIPGGRHLNAEAGYIQFPQLRDMVVRTMERGSE